MSRRPSPNPATSAWARLAACLSFLALLSALLAPVSMLAQEVRSGQLGGICSVNASLGSSQAADAGSGEQPQAGSHCDLCGTLGLALPPLAAPPIPCLAGHQPAAVRAQRALARLVTGLPFSRGPPPL